MAMYYQVQGGHIFLYLMTEEMSKRGTAEELAWKDLVGN